MGTTAATELIMDDPAQDTNHGTSCDTVRCGSSHGRGTLAWIADRPGQRFQQRFVDLGPLGPDHVEVDVEFCGLCGSDAAMWHNQWQRTRFPFVGGHEVIGRVRGLGSRARGLSIGQRVGLGWYSGSCLVCSACRAGHLHQCLSLQRLVIDGYGGFADRVRTHWAWAFPLPDGLPAERAGPLFCGGITVFSPISAYARPIHRTAVIGVGGLGHLAIRFLNRFGCEVVAFTGPDVSPEQIMALGAHQVMPSDAAAADIARAGPFDFILVTTSALIDLTPFVSALGHQGRLHVLGVDCAPLTFSPDRLMTTGAQVSSSAIGSPGVMLDMLNFAARHHILPDVEIHPMSRINDAFDRLASGQARYRIVLQSDSASIDP